MIVNLIKPERMFSLTLPGKVKGQYWIKDVDSDGNQRQLISIEAVGGQWVVKSNKTAAVLNADKQPVSSMPINPRDFFYMQIDGISYNLFLYAEAVDESRQAFWKIMSKTPGTYGVGRSEDNEIAYPNAYVSARHAQLEYDGNNWYVTDMGSANGTYVNSCRIAEKSRHSLKAGDYVYIMGLKLIVGHGFFAVNNPDNSVVIRSDKLVKYTPQYREDNNAELEEPKKEYFFRSPRLYREVEHQVFKLDAPPQPARQDTVPMALMLGPSITMGMTSMSTGILSAVNVLSSGGAITQALPTIMMSGSMLLGTVLWPVLTKKYEKKQAIINEAKRQGKYLEYLDGVRDSIMRTCREQEDILRENNITPEECAKRVLECQSSLWERMRTQSDFLNLRLGIGTLPMDGELDFPDKRFSMEDDNLQAAMLALGKEGKLLKGVPVTVSLLKNNIVGIYGSQVETDALLRTLIIQLVALHSYDELKIMLLTGEKDVHNWEFIRPIRHFWNDDRSMRFFAASEDEVKELSQYIENNVLQADATKPEPYYVIICTDKKLYEKSSTLQKLIQSEADGSFSVIFAEKELKLLPKETKLVIAADGGDSRIYDREDNTGKYVGFRHDSFDTAVLDKVSQRIADIELDEQRTAYAMPDMLTFLEMFNVSKIEHLNSLTRWKENNPIISLKTPVGIDENGETFNLDLHEKFHGPHGLVAGMTGSGKSEFIITYILSLAVNYHPDEVAFVLIDYKGGGMTGAFEDTDRGIKLPHLAGTITNLDGSEVKRSLVSIQSELRRRQAIFNEARKISNEGTMDIYKYQQLYRDKLVSEPVPHLFIISDEFAELKAQQPEFMQQLISAARIGRSLGVHLILATQKPSGVVDDQIWSNSKFRVCLKVQDKSDSQEMIKRPDAAALTQTGRFYLQVGYDELFALGQSAWCGAEYVPTETVERSIDRSVQVIDNLGRVVMNVKPQKKKDNGSKVKQLVSIVRYLSELAKEENISVRPLWLPPLKKDIYIDELEDRYGYTTCGNILEPVIGEYDDPFNQKQGILTVPLSREGNCLVYGSAGNGKTTFVTTLCYSLIRHHSADEVNLYIMDFGSETLKVFEKAPQVGGVVLSADEEKLTNLLKLLNREIETRKALFAEYGGDYAGYCKNSGSTLPNIVVILNNYSGFAEQYEDMQEVFELITRDCVKFGIYFVVTAGSTNAIRYKLLQNFKMIYTMQLNDATDYPVIMGKTDGLVPSKYKGRGLVLLDRVYEFQTAYCIRSEEMQEALRLYVRELSDKAVVYARPIPMLPDRVDAGYFAGSGYSLKSFPVGVVRRTLKPAVVNIESRVMYTITAQEMYDTVPFAEELIKLLSDVCRVRVFDAEKLCNVEAEGVEVITGNYEQYVRELFSEMVERNNVYKDSGLEQSVLEKYETVVYVMVGLNKLFSKLGDDAKDKLRVLMEKAEAEYKLHIIAVDTAAGIGTYMYDGWYRRQLNGADGVWIGDGIADQNIYRISKLTSDLYAEVEEGFGYFVYRGRTELVKLISSTEEA